MQQQTQHAGSTLLVNRQHAAGDRFRSTQPLSSVTGGQDRAGDSRQQLADQQVTGSRDDLLDSIRRSLLAHLRTQLIELSPTAWPQRFAVLPINAQWSFRERTGSLDDQWSLCRHQRREFRNRPMIHYSCPDARSLYELCEKNVGDKSKAKRMPRPANCGCDEKDRKLDAVGRV